MSDNQVEDLQHSHRMLMGKIAIQRTRIEELEQQLASLQPDTVSIDGIIVGSNFFGELVKGMWTPHSYQRMAQLRAEAEQQLASLQETDDE